MLTQQDMDEIIAEISRLGLDWPSDPYGFESPRIVRCAADCHRPIETGFKISECRRCKTKLEFINWEWREVT
jgi:hypothetical protein